MLPNPVYPRFEVCSQYLNLEFRHFDLIPGDNWNVDFFKSLKALVDKNTAAMVIINPGNPCAYVYIYTHLKEVGHIEINFFF